jgi:hypothetical protein
MKQLIAGLATTVVISGGLGLTSVALAGTAQARPLPPHTWCPGNSMVYSTYDLSSGPGVAYQWDMNICHTWYWTKLSDGNVPYKGELPSGVWDGENPPSIREDSCDFCW